VGDSNQRDITHNPKQARPTNLLPQTIHLILEQFGCLAILNILSMADKSFP
jgi:hypothetical protein